LLIGSSLYKLELDGFIEVESDVDEKWRLLLWHNYECDNIFQLQKNGMD
jgi:hypothetical protein